jgi:DNA-binding NarL/FixJ family response regulator
VALRATDEIRRFPPRVRRFASSSATLPVSGAGCAALDPRRLVPALLDVLSGKPAIPRSLVALLVSEYRYHGPRRRMLVPPLPGAALTSREWEVLDLVGKGCDTGEIARLLHVSRATVRSHRAAARRKVGGRGAAR